MFTEAQLVEAQMVMEELPRIEAALKSFLSLKMAEGLTVADVAGQAPASSSAQASVGPASARALQGCARVLLRTLNALELPSSPEWGLRHPQGDESGGDYMDRLGHYKVVQVLWERCRGAGQKPAKMLGRSALRFALPEAQAAILADAPASAKAANAAEHQLRLFLQGFHETVDAESQEGEAGLVWAVDVKAAVAARHEARKSEAAERLDRAATQEGFAQELRDALSSSGHVAGGSSSVQVEELPDDDGGNGS